MWSYTGRKKKNSSPTGRRLSSGGIGVEVGLDPFENRLRNVRQEGLRPHLLFFGGIRHEGDLGQNAGHGGEAEHVKWCGLHAMVDGAITTVEICDHGLLGGPGQFEGMFDLLGSSADRRQDIPIPLRYCSAACRFLVRQLPGRAGPWLRRNGRSPARGSPLCGCELTWMEMNRSASLPFANLARSSSSIKASRSRVMRTRVFGNGTEQGFQQQPDFQGDIFFRRPVLSDCAGIFSAMPGINDDRLDRACRFGRDRTSRFRDGGAWNRRWSRQGDGRGLMAMSSRSHRSAGSDLLDAA